MTLVKFNNPKRHVPGSFDQLIDQLLNNTNVSTINSYGFNPSKNVIDHEDAYEIQFALPGWKKDELNISLDNDVLIVKGEKKEEELKAEWLIRELHAGSFESRLKLPEDIKDEVKASLKDGVLQITLAKNKEYHKKKQISIG